MSWSYWGRVGAAAIVGGVIGGALPTNFPISRDQIHRFGVWAYEVTTIDRSIAAVSSLAALAAALATFWTVREMKQSRISSARARITSLATDQLLRFAWDLKTNMVTIEGDVHTITRNASQGLAKNIHVTWVAQTDLNALNFQTVHELAGPSNTVVVSANAQSIEFYKASNLISKLPVSRSDFAYLGDLGASQDQTVDIPVPILNYAILKWLSLSEKILTQTPISPSETPSFELIFTHDSPYESDLRDQQLVRFHLASYALEGANSKSLSYQERAKAQRIEMTVRSETSSQRLDEFEPIAV